MFLRKFLLGKIHRATVTGADVNYMGSITIDVDLIEAAGLLPLEEVDVWDVTNGARFSTYVIPGERGSGEVIINGAAAHLAHVGDKVIIAAYTQRDSAGLGPHECSVVIPDDQNRPAKTFRYVADLANRSFAVEGLDDD